MITNCDFRFVCPMNWDDMPDLPDGRGKHCTQYQRPVITVRNRGEFNAAAKRGDCVAVMKGEEEKLVLCSEPIESIHDPDQTPPYDWSEIEDNLRRRTRARRSEPRPDNHPDCPRCGKPMRWIFFRSDPWTWAHECGRAGWVPICKPCREWLALRETMMS